MKEPEDRIPGDWSTWHWLLLGLLGVALAVAIALVAGGLASQPVGLTGEPVSAGSALDPATRVSEQPARKADRKRRKNANSSSSGSDSGSDDSGGSASTGAPTYETDGAPAAPAPPVSVDSTGDQTSAPVRSGGSEDHGEDGHHEGADD